MKFILVLKCISKENNYFRIEKVVEFDDALYNSYQKKYKPYELKVVEVKGTFNLDKFYKVGDCLSDYNENHEKVKKSMSVSVNICNDDTPYDNLVEKLDNKYLKEEYEKDLKNLETKLFNCYNVLFNHQNRFYVEETLSFLTHVYLLDFDDCEIPNVDGDYIELGKTDYHKLYLELFNKKQRILKIIKENQKSLRESKDLKEFLDVATRYKHDLICMINNENKREEKKK